MKATWCRPLFGPCARILIQEADPKPRERVLDVGCGTGIVAREVASRLGTTATVTAVDLSAHMLAVARAVAAEEGLIINAPGGNRKRARSNQHVAGPRSPSLLPDAAHVIQQRLGMSALQEIFALGNADDLRVLALAAGFRRVDIKPFSLTARFPDPEAFIAGEIEVDTAAIPSMQHLDSQAREAIVRAIASDMQSPLKKLISDSHVVIPFHGLIMTARTLTRRAH